jgi:hypothetical protein
MYTIEIQDLSKTNQLVLETSIAPVQSVNGKKGIVNITPAIIGLDRIDNTADIDKPVSIPVSGAITEAIRDLEQRILSQVQLTSSDDLEFQVPLYAGIDSLYVNYPINLAQKPKSVICTIENNIDNLIYNFLISNVTNIGFNIEFSDFLSSDGYILHVEASI